MSIEGCELNRPRFLKPELDTIHDCIAGKGVPDDVS